MTTAEGAAERAPKAAQKIKPFLWFENQAEEAAKFYVSLFKNSEITGISHYPEGTPGPTGSVMTVDFKLNGQDFTALNGGPNFKFTEAVSFVVNCDTQEEIDHYWEKLSEGGQKSQCGWLKDRYGLSWQIVPTILPELILGKDPETSKRVMGEVMKMTKLEIQPLKDAAENKG